MRRIRITRRHKVDTGLKRLLYVRDDQDVCDCLDPARKKEATSPLRCGSVRQEKEEQLAGAYAVYEVRWDVRIA